MKTLIGVTVLVVGMCALAATPADQPAEDLYRDALDAVEAGNHRAATDAITRALAQTGHHDPVSKATALKRIAEYEIRTGRNESARDHLEAAIESAGTVYSESHPDMAHLRQLLNKLAAGEARLAAGRPE